MRKKKACTPRKINVAAKKHHRSSLQTPKRTYIIVCTCAAPCVPEKTHHGCCWEKLQRAHMSRNRQRPHAAHKHAPQPKKRHHSSRTNTFNAAMNSFCPHVAPGVQKRAPSVVGVLVRHALAEQRHMRKKKACTPHKNNVTAKNRRRSSPANTPNAHVIWFCT